MKKILVAALLASSVGALFAQEEEVPEEINKLPDPTCVQVSLASPLHLPSKYREVTAFRWNIFYGRSLAVTGFDLGLVNLTAESGNMVGLELGLYNYVDGAMEGVQLGLFGNYAYKNSYGVQLSTIMNWNVSMFTGAQASLFNYDSELDGAQLGFLNWCYGAVEGAQFGIVNVARNDFTGFALGAINYCEGGLHGAQVGLLNMISGSSYGFQLGLLNAAEEHTGVQIGLLNLNTAALMPILPLVNASFR